MLNGPKWEDTGRSATLTDQEMQKSGAIFDPTESVLLVEEIVQELRGLESYGATPKLIRKNCDRLMEVMAVRHPQEAKDPRFAFLVLDDLRKALLRCPPKEREVLLRLLRLTRSASDRADDNRRFAIGKLGLHIDVETFRRRENEFALDLYRLPVRLLLFSPLSSHTLVFVHRDIQHEVGPTGALLSSRYIETVQATKDGVTECLFSTEYPDDNSPDVIAVEAIRGCEIGDAFTPTYPNRSLVSGRLLLPRLHRDHPYTFEFVAHFDTAAPMRPHVWETVGTAGTQTCTLSVKFPKVAQPRFVWSFVHTPVPLAIPSEPCGELVNPWGGRFQHTFHEPTSLYGLAWRQ